MEMTSYQKDLIESLKDPCEASAYLNAAIEEGDRSVFLLALRNVAEAKDGSSGDGFAAIQPEEYECSVA